MDTPQPLRSAGKKLRRAWDWFSHLDTALGLWGVVGSVAVGGLGVVMAFVADNRRWLFPSAFAAAYLLVLLLARRSVGRAKSGATTSAREGRQVTSEPPEQGGEVANTPMPWTTDRAAPDEVRELVTRQLLEARQFQGFWYETTYPLAAHHLSDDSHMPEVAFGWISTTYDGLVQLDHRLASRFGHPGNEISIKERVRVLEQMLDGAGSPPSLSVQEEAAALGEEIWRFYSDRKALRPVLGRTEQQLVAIGDITATTEYERRLAQYQQETEALYEGKFWHRLERVSNRYAAAGGGVLAELRTLPQSLDGVRWVSEILRAIGTMQVIDGGPIL